MPECIYQFKFSDVQHEFVHKLLSLHLKTNVDELHMDATGQMLDWNRGTLEMPVDIGQRVKYHTCNKLGLKQKHRRQ